MSKYQPLSARFAGRLGDEWGASFSELEAVLGFPLPKAARAGRAWWTNDPAKSHSRSWAEHGWEVGDVDHAAGRVVFRRAPSGVALATSATLTSAPVVSDAVQPPALKAAAETASARMHTNRAVGVAMITAAAATALAGLSAWALRRVRRG